MSYIGALDPIGGVDLPGELFDPPPDALDLLPTLGGCGDALRVVAYALAQGSDSVTAHLAACGPCREALIGLGHLAGGLDALCYFDRLNTGGLNTEAPHAISLAATA